MERYFAAAREVLERHGGSVREVHRRRREVVAYCAGDMGWAVGWIRFQHPSGRGDALFRATAVFIREEGDWKIVLWTLAVLVPDEVTLGDDWPVVAG